jgi:hypothetical protein
MLFSAAVCIRGPDGHLFGDCMSGNQLPANTDLQKLAVDCERDNLVGTALGKETFACCA